jgi:hypothetical protein
MATPKLLNLQILSSVENLTFTNLGSSVEPAVVTVTETFILSAVVRSARGIRGSINATLILPPGSGYMNDTATPLSQTVSLLAGDTIVEWEVVAQSTPDTTSAQTFTVEVAFNTAAAGAAPAGASAKQTIDVIAGPSQLVFTTSPFTVVVGQPSPQITVQAQNFQGRPQSPATTTTVNLGSSSSGGGFFSDPACKRASRVGPVTITSPANSASFYYQDAVAGKQTITATDSPTLASSLGSVPQTETINEASTTTLLTAAPTSTTVGQKVTLAATVAVQPPGSGSPAAQVQFTVNSSAGSQTLRPATLRTAEFTPQVPGTYTITATYPDDGSFSTSHSHHVRVTVSPATVMITGLVETFVGHTQISGVNVVAQDSTGKQIGSCLTGTDRTGNPGSYSIPVPSGEPFQVLFQASCVWPSNSTQSLYLESPASIYVGQPTTTALPPAYYELKGCQVSGVVQQMVGTKCQPLSGVQVSLVDSSNTAKVYGTTTDAEGNFCLNPEKGTNFVLQMPATAGKNTLVLSPQSGSNTPPTQTTILLSPDAPLPILLPFVYTPQLSTVFGQVTDGENGLAGISVQLSVQSGLQTAVTDLSGVYTFSNLPSGSAQLRFKATSAVAGATWELRPGQQSTQSFSISGGQPVQAATVAYQPEQHSIEQLVLMDGRPAENVLVAIRPKGAHFDAQSQRTGTDGKAYFSVPTPGSYLVYVYPDLAATGGPQVNEVQCASHAVSPTVSLPNPGGGGGGGGRGDNGGRAAIDLQAYPVLTEAMPPGMMSPTTSTGSAATVGGTSALGQAADRAIREVLSWRTKSDDAKGFLTALGQAFDLKEVEGHTEFTWTPRSYTVQTDMGAVTGAQASIYTRAKVALDQSMPLLDGLYPLVPNVEAEDLATIQSVVRSQFTSLVNEFGTVGGPRVSRVDELFELLIGPVDPDAPRIKPLDIVKGSLGLVKKRFGLDRSFVTTVDDEQNLTNYLILVDYVIGLDYSWIHDKDYFIRNGVKPGFSPFFGTQLVLISRALDVVGQAVQDAYFAMDSVFMGDAERQIAQLDFANLQVKVPNPRTGAPELHTFKPGTSGLFVAELLDWIDRAATDELPRLLQDAGKDGLESLELVTDRLRRFAHGAIVPPQDAPSLPPGYYTPRVKRAMQLLADGLDETYKLAVQLRPVDLPVDLSPDGLRRLIRDEISKAAKAGPSGW